MWKIFFEYNDKSKITITGNTADVTLGQAVDYHNQYGAHAAKEIFQKYPKAKNPSKDLYDLIEELQEFNEDDVKYYEVLFKDQYGICIKSAIENPTAVQVAEFLKVDMDNNEYTIDDIEDIAELTLDEAEAFYDMENEKEFPILGDTNKINF